MDEEREFGALLKRYRRAVHLTQQDLAERAGYSAHYVSMLERGVRVPQPLTIDLLADALQLGEEDRRVFHATAVPRPRARPTMPHVPEPAVSLIGRERDLTQILRLLRESSVRLVTLTGSGGVGKTALARQAALALKGAFRDGIVVVDLTAVGRPEGVIPAVARCLSLRELGGQSTRERLLAFLQEQEMVLVLDCFERVVDAADVVTELLAICTDIKLLVTSRLPLRLQTEHVFRVGPLALPESGSSPGLDDLLRSPAVALFLERARLAEPGLALDDGQLDIVADICRQVDGLPLAIELAAARVTHLPLITLRDRLHHRLEILTGGSRDLPARQQRMRDCIAWSYELLPRSQQSLLRQLSVFTGSWSLEAAEAVCGGDQAGESVLDGLRSLVESSLVTMSGLLREEPRYRMLDTIQEYAHEQLAAAGELHVTREQHAGYYLDLAEQAELPLQDRDQRFWYPRLEREHDNLRSALRWLLGSGDSEAALRLAGAIWRFWQRHGDIREGRDWLEEGLRTGEHVPAAVRAKALWGASWLAYYEGDYGRTKDLSTEHLALARKQDDGLSLRNALTGIGMAALAEGRYAEAVRSFEDAVQACQPFGNIWHRGTSLLNLGTATMLAGDLSRAADLFERALSLYRDRGDEAFAARVLHHLGYVALLRREYEQARSLCAQSLQALFELKEKPGIADGLEAVAALCAARGEPERAARLLGAATTVREEISVVALPALRALWSPFVHAATISLGEANWAAACDEGRSMSLEVAVAIAVSEES